MSKFYNTLKTTKKLEADSMTAKYDAIELIPKKLFLDEMKLRTF